ncbi:hypothetical protein P3T76_000600 [Phytophthora citrophthora]|uniref:Uncharacterized protein n=1 Tax=Phytophthora citrophthora TaxID=4793 RepID=A0AAD9H0C6_9STRA|nr:hypothetical protein P3T76_000600 [Phytophthora citrophthora]
MRRHFVFAEDEKERSVGEGKTNLLQLWHNRRNAMLEGDGSVNGGEANVLVSGELTLLWDLAKPISSCTLNRDGYVAFFARAAKSLILPLSTDAIAIAAAQRDWEYDLEGVGSIPEPDKHSNLDNEEMAHEQFREAVMQLAELILPVESGANVYLTFFRELRHSIAEIVSPSSGPEQDEANPSDPVDRFTLRPLNRIVKIANNSFLQKLPPSSDAMRNIRGLQPPDQREMSLKQLLVSYNPRKLSLTRAFPKNKLNIAAEETASEASDIAKAAVEDDMELAHRLHLELVGSIGSGATPVRGRQLHREITAHWDPEDALVAALTEFPALKVAVVGPPGSGKTRLACVLARRLGLKYLSLNEVVQRAADRKLRLCRRQTATPALSEEDVNVETSPPEEIPTEEEQPEENTAEVDGEMDHVFREEDFKAICTGKVVSRSTALALLRLEATRSVFGA